MRTNYLCIFLFVMKTNDHKLGFIKQIHICIYFSVMSDVLGNAVVVPQENNHEEAQEVPEPMDEEIDDSILDVPSSEEDSEQQRELANLCRLQEALDLTPKEARPLNNVPNWNAMVLSCFSVGEIRYVFEGITIRWVTITSDTIYAVTSTISRFLDDQIPKKLICCCFEQFVGKIPMNEILKNIGMLRAKADKSPIHKLVFASLPFTPTLEPFWPEISDANDCIRNYNLLMNTAPLSLHKCWLKPVRGLPSLCTKGEMWQEKSQGTGLGTTLSAAGKEKAKK